MTSSGLMTSKYFNPAFNSAIFDGPFRIYFAQIHESLALKVYFSLQQKFPTEVQKAKDCHRAHGTTLLILLYPSADAFQMSFEGERQFLIEEQWGEDTLLAINGPFEDEKLHDVLESAARCLEQWDEPVFAETHAPL